MTDQAKTACTVALAGNPNVGKSTVFNALTHLHQHTGNWPGKTVATARGCFTYRGTDFTLVDLPGTYSLLADSPEEEIARDFLQSGAADVTLVVADATCLERNLNLVLQVMERTYPVVLCVNLLDEARKKGIEVDLTALQDALGIPVVGAAVRGGEGLDALREALVQSFRHPLPPPRPQVDYPDVTGLSAEGRQDALTGAILARARELAALAVRRVVKPILQLTAEVEAISPNEPRPRFSPTDLRELDTLQQAFTRLLECTEEANQKVLLAQQTELNLRIGALQAQINPHYLFNSLVL